MNVWQIILGAVVIVFSLIITAIVLLQEGRQANLGVISGAADSLMDKGRARSIDAMLAKWTKAIAVVFFLLMLGGMFINQYLGS